MPTLIPYVKSNRLTGIAVTTARRTSSLPDIPTVAETLPGYEASLWYGVCGPKDLPPVIVERLNRELAAIVQLPNVKTLMANDGLEPLTGPPELLHRTLQADIVKWTNVVKEANVKVVE